MKRQLYMGGGIMDVVPREPAILGGIKKAVKKVTKGVKDIAKSDVGKAALIGAAAFGIPGTQIGGLFGRASFGGPAMGLFGSKGIGATLASSGFLPKAVNPAMQKAIGKETVGGIFGGALKGNVGKLATLGLVSTFLTTELGMTEEQAEEELARDPSTYLEQYYRNLNPPTADTNSEQYEQQVRDFVIANTSEYAVGGRVGYASGTGESGIMKMASGLGDESDAIAIQLFGKPVKELNPDEMQELQDEIDRLMNKFRAEGPVLPPDTTQPVNPFGPRPGDFGIEEDIPIKTASYGYNEAMSDTYDSYLEMKKKGLIPPTMDFDEFLQEVVPEMGSKKIKETRGLAAIGGKMDTASMNAMQAAGVEGLPVRQNPKGVKELDLRETGGFIQPVGIKEKEDDIPAMLSNNEFVMTADAVRGMGGGNVELGAQRMYDQMKMLEAGGKV